MPEQMRWTRRPENSTWGDYGPNDQLGRMNELTPAKVNQGIGGPSDPKPAGAGPGTFVEAKGTSSANALGVENMAVKCLQGRGVMIDLFAHYGRKRRAVGYDDLMRVMAADGIKVEAGDFVLLRTGFDEAILEGSKKPDKHLLETSCTGLDG